MIFYILSKKYLHLVSAEALDKELGTFDVVDDVCDEANEYNIAVAVIPRIKSVSG